MKIKERIEWVDTLKLLLVLAVYCGHIAGGGLLFDFVWKFHVSGLFFASGVTFNYNSNLLYTIKHKFKSIMMPYYFFLIINIAFYTFITNSSIFEPMKQMVLGLFGMKALNWGEPLWFLPALFVINIIYSLLNKFMKKPVFIYISTLVISYIASTYLIPLSFSIYVPYCITFALKFLVWFSTGDFLYKSLKNKRKFILVLPFLFAYMVLLYTGTDLLNYIKINSYFINTVINYFRQLFCISGVILLSIIISLLPNINKYARKTIYFLGNEAIAKNTLTTFCLLVGLNCNPANPFQILLFCIIALCFTYKILIKFEEPIIQTLQNF